MIPHKNVSGIYNNERFVWTLKIDSRFEKVNGGATFSVTGTSEDVSGAVGDYLAEAKPKYAKYVRWHLFNVNKDPMHYLANARYWLGLGKYSEYNLDNFKSTIVFGAVANDEHHLRTLLTLPTVQQAEYATFWLNERKEALFAAFEADMTSLFGVSPYKE